MWLNHKKNTENIKSHQTPEHIEIFWCQSEMVIKWNLCGYSKCVNYTWLYFNGNQTHSHLLVMLRIFLGIGLNEILRYNYHLQCQSHIIYETCIRSSLCLHMVKQLIVLGQNRDSDNYEVVETFWKDNGYYFITTTFVFAYQKVSFK